MGKGAEGQERDAFVGLTLLCEIQDSTRCTEGALDHKITTIGFLFVCPLSCNSLKLTLNVEYSKNVWAHFLKLLQSFFYINNGLNSYI